MALRDRPNAITARIVIENRHGWKITSKTYAGIKLD